MNLLISASRLAEAAATAARAVRSGRPNSDGKSPVLRCCRVVANGHLTIYGTDLDTGIAGVADCDVIEPGVAVVDGHKLAETARKLIRNDVQLEDQSGNLVIKTGRSRFTLTMQSDEDFPMSLVVDHDGDPLELTATDVMAIFDGAAAGAADDDTRIYLAGVHLFSEPTDFGRRLCGVGTDNTGLSYAATTVACPDLGQGVLVHWDTCKLAVDLFGKTGASLRLGKRLVQFESDSHRLVAKMIDAIPPAWRSAVPPIEIPNSATVPASDFKAALELCLAVINNLTGDLAKRSPSVTIWWDADAGVEVRIAFRNINTEVPAGYDVIASNDLVGNVDISVDPHKLRRLLEGMKADNIRLSAQDRSSSLRIDAGPDRFVVLTPMRVFTTVFEEEAA